MTRSLTLAAAASVAIAAALWAGRAQAVPNAFTYSGFLLNPGGDPVTATTTVTFGFFDTANLNTTSPNYEEGPVTVVPTKEGYISAIAGTTVPASFFSGNVWLTLKVGNEQYMGPRLQLTSAPAAVYRPAVNLAAQLVSTSTSIPASSCNNFIDLACPTGYVATGVGCSSFSGSLVISNQFTYGSGGRCGFCNNAAVAQTASTYLFCTTAQ